MVTIFYLIAFLLALHMFFTFLIRNRKCDSVLIMFSVLVVLNCGGYYFLSISKTLEMALFFNKVVYVGGCFAPLFTVILLSRLCNLKIPRIVQAVMTIFSTVVLLLAFTIGKSEIYYKSVELVCTDSYSYLEKTYAPLHVLYPILVILYGIILLNYMIYAIQIRKTASVRLIMIIASTGLVGFVFYLLEKILGTNISMASLGYLFGIGLISKYYTRINMFDLSANLSASLERMGEYAYLIFDNEYRYFNSNELARKLFPEINEWIRDKVVPPSDSYLYKEVVQYLLEWQGEAVADKTICSGELYYRMHIRHISYGDKKKVGYLIELMDCTIEHQYYVTIEKYNEKMEQEIAEKTKELQLQQEQIQKLFIQTVIALSEAVEAKDRYTSGHSRRVAEYSRKIAERMGKSKEEQDEIYYTGLLHDVGKIRVPVDIINKPGKLTAEEFDIIKIHPVSGYHILRSISENSDIAISAKYHHERYDGKGYPNGLIGESIPEFARILCVADSYDAMTSNRSYRGALSQDVVRGEIEKGKGTQFDPQIAEIMLQMIDEDVNYRMRQEDMITHNILVVDDEAMNFKIIEMIMRDEPEYKLTYAESGIAALNNLKENPYDLVLLDVMMSGMDGVETLKSIREISSVPVVLMSGDRSLGISGDFAKLGCNDFVTKPFPPVLIKEVIKNMSKKTGGLT